MESQYYEVEETDEQHKQRLNAAMVEWLLEDWMMTSGVCLSPLLGLDELNKNDNEPDADDEEGDMR